jgi:hypothetical protein
MGLDIRFIEPSNQNLEEDSEEWDYLIERGIRIDNLQGVLRIIDWFPYTNNRGALTNVWPLDNMSLYPNIRETAGYTFTQFLDYLTGLHAWILDNASKYKYLIKPKYEWQKEFFKDNNYIMFGDIQSINSAEKPDDKASYFVKHHIYWTDKRDHTELSLDSDEKIVESFIKALQSMGIKKQYIVQIE